MEENITALTSLIVIICLIIAILIKGVTVTYKEKNIVNQHMSWVEYIKLINE